MAATDHNQTVKFNKRHITVERRDLSSRYDAFEVHPCQAFDKYGNVIHDTTKTAVSFYGQCSENSEDIAVWSVYGHLRVETQDGNPVGGLENIADCATKEDAIEVASALGLLLLSEGIEEKIISLTHDPRVPVEVRDPRWSDDGTA